MTHLNRVFGAHVVSILTGQYEDPEGQAIYYRIPLGAITPDPVVKQDVLRRRAAAAAHDHEDDELAFDLASGLDAAVRVRAALAARARGAGPALRSGGQQADADELRHAGDRARARVDRRARARAAAHLPDLVARRGDRQGAAADPVHAQGRRRSRSGSPAATTATPRRPAARCPIRRSTAAVPGTSRGRASRTRRAPGRPRRSPRCAPRSRPPAARTRSSASSTSWSRSAPAPCCRRTSSPRWPRCAPSSTLPLIAVETTTHSYRSGRGAVPVDRRRARARRARLVGRRPDRLPPHLGALVHRLAAHAGLDLGR